MRQAVDNNELCEPLDADTKGHAERAHARGEDLGGIEPRDTVPTDTIEEGVDVHHGDGAAGPRVHGRDAVKRA